MPTFLCEKCGAIENTATSNYWLHKLNNEEVLCSMCESGVWHGKFERRHWSYYGVSSVLQAQKRNKGDCINAREHLRNIGVIGSKKNIKKEEKWIEDMNTNKEQELHNNRKIFAFYDGKLNFCEKEGLSHHDWLVKGRIFCDFVFNEIVRGYYDSEGVYFYVGDFETNSYVEEVAKSCLNYFDDKLPVYCGVIKGEIGEKWKPIHQIR